MERHRGPHYSLALHDTPWVPAGKVAYVDGPILSASDSIDITVRGYGGHGAAPQATKDPVASEIVMILQTIVSRKTDPLEHVVVTVGSFHSGTRYNIIRTIPDDAHLQLTVRTMTPQMRAKVLAAITRITNGVAQAAGVPDERKPIIEISKDNVPATVNDAALTERVATAMEKSLGKENVVAGKPIMASEDFSLFALTAPNPPTMMFWLGASDPVKYKGAVENGTRFARSSLQRIRPVTRTRHSHRRIRYDRRSNFSSSKVGAALRRLSVLHGFGGSLLAGAASFAPPPLASFTISAALCWLKWHAGS